MFGRKKYKYNSLKIHLASKHIHSLKKNNNWLEIGLKKFNNIIEQFVFQDERWMNCLYLSIILKKFKFIIYALFHWQVHLQHWILYYPTFFFTVWYICIYMYRICTYQYKWYTKYTHKDIQREIRTDAGTDRCHVEPSGYTSFLALAHLH